TDFIGHPPGWGLEQIKKNEDENYHQPSDELTPDWNFDGMVEDTQLGFLTGLGIAEADEIPTWTPGDEFEAARKGGIAAAANGGATAAASPSEAAGATPAPTE